MRRAPRWGSRAHEQPRRAQGFAVRAQRLHHRRGLGFVAARESIRCLVGREPSRRPIPHESGDTREPEDTRVAQIDDVAFLAIGDGGGVIGGQVGVVADDDARVQDAAVGLSAA